MAKNTENNRQSLENLNKAESMDTTEVTRRKFVIGAGAGSIAVGLVTPLAAQEKEKAKQADEPKGPVEAKFVYAITSHPHSNRRGPRSKSIASFCRISSSLHIPIWTWSKNCWMRDLAH